MSRGRIEDGALLRVVSDARAAYETEHRRPTPRDDAETLEQYRARMVRWDHARDVAIARGVLALVEGVGARPVRPIVEQFARAMEAKLAANDHKGGWQRDTTGALLDRLREEADELRAAVLVLRNTPSVAADVARAAVRDEAADVANFAMFVADVCGGLAEERPALSRAEERPDHDARARGARLVDISLMLMSGGSARTAAEALALRMSVNHTAPRPLVSEHIVGAAGRMREIASELVGLAAERGPA